MLKQKQLLSKTNTKQLCKIYFISVLNSHLPRQNCTETKIINAHINSEFIDFVPRKLGVNRYLAKS